MTCLANSRSRQLLNLDDQCLHIILRNLDPIPDRFNASITCKRLQRLCCDSKLWISVHTEDAPGIPPSKHTHSTLQAAVHASRPGDSIHLGPGEHTAEGVRIEHPLRLIGAPGSTLLCRKQRADAALELWSNVKLEGLDVQAHRAFCVRHHDGDVTLSRCRLICHAGRFSHLYCALVAETRQHEGLGGGDAPLSSRRAAGSLTVEETTISGALRAVQCRGDGELQDVRMLQGRGGCCFWFRVEQGQVAERQRCMTERVLCGSVPVLERSVLHKRRLDWGAREWYSTPSGRARWF